MRGDDEPRQDKPISFDPRTRVPTNCLGFLALFDLLPEKVTIEWEGEVITIQGAPFERTGGGVLVLSLGTKQADISQEFIRKRHGMEGGHRQLHRR